MKKRFLPALLGPAVMAMVFALLVLGCPQPGNNEPPVPDAEEVVILYNGNAAETITVILENISAGFQRQLSASVEPYPEASQTVTWSIAPYSAESLSRRASRFSGARNAETPTGVEISADGLVTIRSDATQGRWVITATATNGIADTLDVFVVSQRPTGITVDLSKATLERDRSDIDLEGIFYVQVEPAHALQYVKWEICPGSAAIDGITLTLEGLLTIGADVEVGTEIIVWVSALGDGDVADYVTITVDYRAPTGVILEPEGPLNIARDGEARTFTATVQPPSARQVVAWSIYPDDVTGVDFDYDEVEFTLLVDATVDLNTQLTIRATVEGVEEYGEAILTVVYAPASYVYMDPDAVDVILGVTFDGEYYEWDLRAEVRPFPGASQVVTWAYAPYVPAEHLGRRIPRFFGALSDEQPIGVSVNASGVLTVLADATPAIWRVTATTPCDEIGVMFVRIFPTPAVLPGYIDVSPRYVTMERGDQRYLEELFDVQVGPYGAPEYIVWDIDSIDPALDMPSDVVLSGGGLLEVAASVPVGTIITVRVWALGFEDTVYDYVDVHVDYTAPTSVTLDPVGPISIVHGGERAFAATVQPLSASQEVEWSIYPENTAGVSISPDGLLTVDETAEAPSSFVVRATTGDAEPGEATVNVFAPATEVIVTPNPVFLIRGGSQQFSARVEPYPAASQAVTWSRHRIGATGVAGFSINATGNVTIGNTTAQNSMWEVRAMVAGVPAGVADVRVLQAFPTGINVEPGTARGVQRGTPEPVNLTTLFSAATTPATAPNDLLAWELVGEPVPGVELNNNLLTVEASVPVPTAVNLRLSVSWFENIAPVDVTVNIVYRDPVITVTPSSANVDRNSSQTFTVTMDQQPGGRPTNTIVWSSYPEVPGVTLNPGGDTATLEVGTTAEIGRTITVTAGLQEDSAVRGSATATVTPVAPTSVTIDRTSLGDGELTRGQSLELTAVVVAENWASDEIVWSVSPAGAGTFNPANEHSTVFTVANIAGIGPITITARAVVGNVQDEVGMTIIIIGCPACGEPDCGVTFCGLVIRRGGPNPFGTRGAINHIQLAYSFGGPSAATGVSYTMYFIEGEETDPVRIRADGESRSVGQQPADAPGFVTDFFFDFDLTYSVVIVRRQGQEEQTSNVTLIPRVPNNILIVNGIPETSEVMVSALIGEASTDAPDTRAVGYRIPGVIPGMPATTRVFVFYELDGPCLGPANPESGQFDPTRPWTGTANVFITLATHEAADEGRQYIQAINLFGLPIPQRQNFNSNRLTRQWSNFVFNPF